MDKKKILVVDDDPAILRLLSTNLKARGYDVITATDGEEALETVQKDFIDLIILDMIMAPGIDGLETYRQIIGKRPGQKAIITSGFSETGKVKEAQRLGAGEYIKKPYSIEEIGLAVKYELNGHQHRAA